MNKPFFDSDWQFGDYPANSTFSLSQTTQHLLDAIHRGKAVVYLGAGVSKAAGLPDWKEFLRYLADEATGYSAATAKSVSCRIESGELLVAAEMLQNVLGNSLQEITHRVFGRCVKPTAIHNAVACVPFSLSITTNYDSLAEFAYEIPAPKLTWQNPYDLLQNLRSGQFCILKLHGDYAVRKSIVLTRTNYRDLMQINEMLQNCIRMLLATRCFLFIGVSFSDPDLLALMDEAKALYGDAFGPHFAIFPERHHDAAYSDVLLKAYNIHTIVAPALEDKCGKIDSTTNGVAAVVSHIGGRVGLMRQVPLNPVLNLGPLNSVEFGERMIAGAILRDLVANLGQVYGEVSMLNPVRSEQRVIFPILRYSMAEQAIQYDDSYLSPVSKSSLQNRVFLQRKIENDFCIASGPNSLREQGFPTAQYHFQDRRSSTAVVLPIYVDGRREGVLAIEGKEGFHFSKYHYEVARAEAQRIGAVRNDANRTYKLAKSLRYYGEKHQNFIEFLRRSRDLDNINLNCLVYQIDPYRGSLKAPVSSEEDRKRLQTDTWGYDVEANSLACKAFQERRTVREPRSERVDGTTTETALAIKGKLSFDISGPVVAFPINVDGNTAGVFVGWSRDATKRQRRNDKPNMNVRKWRLLFWRAMERAKRMLHLLANEPHSKTNSHNDERAFAFLEYISDGLATVDDRKDWGSKVFDPAFRAKVIDHLLASLSHESCGIKRARLFVYKRDSEHSPIRAICIGSYSHPSSLQRNQKIVNEYLGAVAPPNDYVGQDPFLDFTRTRADFDPYARVQDSMTVGGSVDPTVKELNKVPDGDWLIAPVGTQRYNAETGERLGMKTVGYLAADNYIYDKKTKEMIQSQKFATQTGDVIFQRYCLDFVSDLLSVFLAYEVDKPSIHRTKNRARSTKKTAKSQTAPKAAPSRRTRTRRN